MKAKVKCPKCGRKVAETTDKFDPDVRPNGSMIKLAEPYASRGWAKIIQWTVATMCSHIFCPNCEAALAPSGRFVLVDVDRVGDAAKGRQEMIDALLNEDEDEVEKPEEASSKSKSKRVAAQSAEDSCPKCGKPMSSFKNKSGFVNHQRHCKG